MKKIFLYFALLLATALFAQKNINEAQILKEQEYQKELIAKEEEKKEKIAKHKQELQALEEKITKKDSVWMKSYASYITSLEIRESLGEIKEKIKLLESKGKKSLSESDELVSLVAKEKILASQIEKLKKKDSTPFSNILTPPNIDEVPSITNPMDIFAGISFVKTAEQGFSDYNLKKKELGEIVSLLKAQMQIYTELQDLNETSYKDAAMLKHSQLESFASAYDTMSVTADVYEKRLDVIEVNINKDIEYQIVKLAKIGVIVFVIFVIFFLLKLFIKKYITDNERFYMANKIITFLNVTIVILILFFSYIENVSYLVTILGFASAGIAIAMKDWFMSILGWLVIVIGGSLHVGDRVRVDMDGFTYVGDILDISLLRMALHEDVTLTTVDENRRAGRIIFVPNNFVFTKMIANYTHSSLKTVWDGIDITITFDSNHKKAMHLAKEITKKYSKGYMEITRKQLNKLRNNYSLKNTNVEPRIFSFIEPNGLRISSWYLTNAYATLTLRSVISIEIVDAFLAEDDITIAYPTQMLHLEKSLKKTPPFATHNSIV